MGIISTADLMDREHSLSMQQLSGALSDLMRRWLEPEHLPKDNTVGKRTIAQWLETTNEIEKQHH